MFRWTMALVVSLSFLSSLAATPAPQKEVTKPVERTAPEKAKEISAEENDEFSLPRQAEVRLDGRPCSYDAVPDSAIIVNLEVAQDRRTIVRVHFRSR